MILLLLKKLFLSSFELFKIRTVLFLISILTFSCSNHKDSDYNIQGVNLKEYKGKTVVLINVASKCGFTPQYADWQKFHEKYGDKMFQLFQRFHTGVDGKGMGLYIVKSQLESHKGSIHVSSKKDHGTVFTITLPKIPAV